MESNFWIEYYKEGQLVREDCPGKYNPKLGYAYCYSGFDWKRDLWKVFKDATLDIFNGDYVDAVRKAAKGSDTTGFTKQVIDIVYDGSYDEMRVMFIGWSKDDLMQGQCGFSHTSQSIGAYYDWIFFSDGDYKKYRVTWTIGLNALLDGAPKTFSFTGYAKDDGWWQDSLASSMLEINYSK